MSNFIEEFKAGQGGGVRGIPFGEGLEKITLDTGGIHKGRMYAVGGPEKAGKSTLVDYAFVIQPYLYAIENNVPINWVYYSYEIDRVSKEFDFVTYFLNRDYGVNNIYLSNGSTRNGEVKIALSPDYLRGYLLDDNSNPIKVHPDLIPLIQEVYKNRIVPMFGEFDNKGNQIKKGLITFIEARENPTGIYKDLIKIAESEGKVIKNSRDEPIFYQSNNPNLLKIVVLDHKLMWLYGVIHIEN